MIKFLKSKKFVLFAVMLFGVLTLALAQADDPFGDGGPVDPGRVPLPGVVYFLIAALGVGAKKIYDARKRF